MKPHPYASQPNHAFWRQAVAECAMDAVDPVVSAPFRIAPTDRVATAGSCFAQHISRHLKEAGFNYFVTETIHPLATDRHFGGEFLFEHYNYGVFTARYGNIYTSRQLLQLIQRAYGDFVPDEEPWPIDGGRVVDPFRPQIQPRGFFNRAELEADRGQHLARVRQALEELDVFVFTLGLTECWVSRYDGAVFPLCPGVAGGTFDDSHYAFVNLGVDEVVREMTTAIGLLRAVNQRARVILTVSPVPLAATATDHHALVATTYSKSVLRVAAEMLSRSLPDVAYFPSYEIITGAYSRGRYYASDLRNVTKSGVAHVMRVFLTHFTEGAVIQPPPSSQQVEESDAFVAQMEAAADAVCEEIVLDQLQRVSQPQHPD